MSYGNSQDSGWQPGKNPTIGTVRKNGVLRGWKSNSKQSRTNAAKRRASGKNRISQGTAASFTGNPYGTEGKGGTGPRHTGGGRGGKKTSSRGPDKYGAWGYSSANLKKKKTGGEEKRRLSIGERVRKGEYKGKYYGHDEFKGDLNALYAWKRAGKPNINKFIKKHGIKGTRSKYDK